MPAVNKGKVLVTGCNGYIAVWVVKSLLEEGFAVRGTVRRESAIPYLKELFSQYGDKFEVVVVPDITKEHAFDEAVKGVDAIEHTASPFHFKASHPSEMVDPAVAGTLSVLKSALRHGAAVRRVVVTSSVAAVLTPDPEHVRHFSEADWNEHSVREIEKGSAASPGDMYLASKTLAERAAWQFVAENKGAVGFDLVTICPPYVYGPFLHEVKNPESLNTSALEFFNSVVKGDKTKEQLTTISGAWVDVRDVATAHVRALQKEAAGGERIITSAGSWVWQDFVSVGHKLDASLPAGDESYDPSKARYMAFFDNSKSKRVLDLEYHTLEECTEDSLAQFKQLGWY
ncbi:NAD dependent epimerase/dehydratase family protein [Phanerochaete sordida]|uniref:NAD dependent epimerase/dehydratase family protein n=1 Tax=Phanerochaete sordida TaxID=48140 RepID=A0A9P3G273_9APHY|nr:NAD dependent epimerase/dehydratase family protein [Phanerochaete sordida]